MGDYAGLLAEIEVDLEDVLMKEPMFARELAVRLDEDPAFLDWWGKEPANDMVIDSLKRTTVKNDYGEYDNVDFIIRSGWSKRKGIGKSSVGVALKLLYDEVITDNGFCLDEVFFLIPQKLEYVKANEGRLERRFFMLDETLPLVGQSSHADLTRMARIDDTTRIKAYNNVYVSPEGEAWFSHDYIIDVVWKDTKNKTIICCLRDIEERALGWLGFPRPPFHIWEKYQRKKLDFLKSLESGEIRQMSFKDAYVKLQNQFDIEGRFEAELEYYDDMADWISSNSKKETKPIKPKLILTPKRLRDWLVAVNPEMTNQELDTGAEVIYSMLEKKYIASVDDDAPI